MQSEANPPTPEARVKKGRRTYIINPAFQWRYAFTIGVVVFFVSTLMSFVLYAGLHHQARQRLIHPATGVSNVTPVVLTFAICLSVVTAGAVGIWCLISSHRVCGPLYVLENYFKDLAAGRVPAPRALRKKDEFQEFYAGFSQAMSALRDDRQQMLNELTVALVAVRSANGADEAGRRKELASAVDQIEKLRSSVALSLGCDLPQLPNVRSGAPREAAPPTPVAVG